MKNNNILCGPFVRRFDNEQLVLWLVTETPQRLSVELTTEQALLISQQHQQIQIGQKCFVHLLTCKCKSQWPINTAISYSIIDSETGLAFDLSHLGLRGLSSPSILKRDKLGSVIQGSCRKPDHHADDAFTAIAARLKEESQQRPDYLIMAGDQIYADDVSSPMLIAVQLLSSQLGLFTAQHEGGRLSRESLSWQNSLDGRRSLLPKKTDISAWSKFWHGDDIISSRYHDNHLVELDEFFACYLLTWSASCWERVLPKLTEIIDEQFSQVPRIQQEFTYLKRFYQQLPDFELALANTPTLMIFDDHDVTDDWNLSADWEHHVYSHDVTKHMIRDALLSYSVFQGWGNDPDQLQPLIDEVSLLANSRQDFASHRLTRDIFDFNRWHYTINTQPKIIVLDTRTHRWRSESSLKNPSGLMDWERLEQLEEELYSAEKSVLLVSAAPIFGVKAIEEMNS